MREREVEEKNVYGLDNLFFFTLLPSVEGHSRQVICDTSYHRVLSVLCISQRVLRLSRRLLHFHIFAP